MALLNAYGRPWEDQEREDAWANNQTGLGVMGFDKTRAGTYLPVLRVMDQELTALYNGSDIAAKIVAKRPYEMFRRGFEIDSDDVKESENDDLRDFATEYLQLEDNLREASLWGRLYGGCLLTLGIDDGGMPWEPLNEENIRAFDSMSLVDRRYSYVQSQYAAMNGTKYGKPEVYLISNAVAGYGWSSYGRVAAVPIETLRQQGAYVTLMHESRVLRFDGHPADVVTRQNLAGWSWSVLQRVYDAMRQFDESFNSAAYLLSDASQGVFKLQGLIKAISSGQKNALQTRLQLVEQTRSVLRGVAIDAGGPDGKNAEDFHREPTPFAGIPDLLDRMMLRLSAAADMPSTELFGRAPQGMNATGDNDTRKWYDTISSDQTNELGPKIRRVFKLLAASKKGPLKGRKKKTDFKVHFKPLWSPTDDELSKTRLQNAQRDQVYVDAGIVKPEEVAVDLSDVYPNIDIEAREKVLEAGLMFDPYENEPPPENPALISAKGQGEPLSPKAPVPLMGTTGTNLDPGALPAVAASEAASHGAAAPPVLKKPTRGGQAKRQGSPKPKKANGKTDRLDSMAASVLESLLVTRQDGQAAGAVFRQLLEDYPADKLGWILAAHWDGPIEVPTEQIDTSNRDKWQATHDGTTDSYVAKMEGGTRKPAVLVQTPNNPKYIIVDGHHRFLASEAMGIPLLAYVAKVHVDNGPWDQLHALQKKGKSGPRSGSWNTASWTKTNAENEHEGHASIAVVRDKDGRVLTVSRPEPPHEMAIPGGLLDDGETPDAAARRELLEETGVRVGNLTHLGTINSPDGAHKVHVHAAESWEGEPKALEEGSRVAWMHPDELHEQPGEYRKSVRDVAKLGGLPPPSAKSDSGQVALDAKWMAREELGKFSRAQKSMTVTTPHGDAHVQLRVMPNGEHVYTARSRKDDGSAAKPMHVRVPRENLTPSHLEAEAAGRGAMAWAPGLVPHVRAQGHALAQVLAAHANELRKG